MSRMTFHIVKKSFGDGPIDCVGHLKLTGASECYRIPEEFQALENHPELLKHNTIIYARNSITKVGQYRNIVLKVTDELRRIYWDEEQNFIFMERVLEEFTPKKENHNSVEVDSEEFSLKDLSKLEKRSSINKFNKANQKAADWMRDFELECSRFGITPDEMKIRALKYFVQDVSEDWYRASLTQFPMDDFEMWKNSFLAVFGERGWTRVEYALGFKYLVGSYADYAMKKLRLLLEVERNMTEESKKNLIVFGLPSEIRQKIDPKDVTGVESLLNELSKFNGSKKQYQPQQSSNRDNRYGSKTPTKAANQEKKACPKCEELGLKKRFHPLDKCWNKDRAKEPKLKINLNEEIETDDEDSKN